MFANKYITTTAATTTTTITGMGQMSAEHIPVFRLIGGAILSVFRATRCTDGVKFGVVESSFFWWSTPPRQIAPPSVQRWSVGLESCKFYEISEYKRPAGAYTLRDFY